MLPIQNNVIDSFEGEYGWLSNFYVEPDGSHVEVEYQQAKCGPRAECMFRGLTPGQAKRLGQKLDIYWMDWDTRRLEVMEFFVRRKFQDNPDLAEKLLATGDAVLIEGNDWGDKFWGQVDGVGENQLGRILMKVREELRAHT